MEEKKFEDVVLESMKMQRDEARKMMQYFESEVQLLENETKKFRKDLSMCENVALIRLYFAKRNLYDITKDYLDMETKIENYVLISSLPVFGNNTYFV